MSRVSFYANTTYIESNDDILWQDTAKMIFSATVNGHLFLFLSAQVLQNF